MTSTIHGYIRLLLCVILPQLAENLSERKMFHTNVVEKDEIVGCLHVHMFSSVHTFINPSNHPSILPAIPLYL
jgi:hypothetical protein